MLPKWHVLYGIIFSLILYWYFPFTFFEISLIVDVDHYLFLIIKKNSFNLRKSYFYHKNLPKKHKPIMHIFHCIEFLILIGILSFYSRFILLIFIGLIFHSILDVIELGYEKRFCCREYGLIRFLLSRKKYPNKYF